MDETSLNFGAAPRYTASPGDSPERLETEIITGLIKAHRAGESSLSALCAGAATTPGIWQNVISGLQAKGLSVETTNPTEPGVFMLTVSDPSDRFPAPPISYG
ncbi:putative transcriptional regulator [Luteimonas sp. 3794]|nr:putative transcriptional regulator [Luteimonas sp. 3794]